MEKIRINYYLSGRHGDDMEMTTREIKHFEYMAHLAANRKFATLPKKINHIVFYRDKRDSNNDIIEAHLYHDMIYMDDKTYEEFVNEHKGDNIGVAHRMY